MMVVMFMAEHVIMAQAQHSFNPRIITTHRSRYDADDMEDIYGHLTNTARAAEDIHFDEAKFVRVSGS